ncbi:MAG TPA: PIG-L family deacetylase [Promineifilum sp.]|nr:PIG-L family deacetylase [Promineifilum sp.]
MKRYDHLYLSPHFDDAILSCGGQIARHTAAGQSVLVVTITGGDPPDNPPSDTVAMLHRRWAASMAAVPGPVHSDGRWPASPRGADSASRAQTSAASSAAASSAASSAIAVGAAMIAQRRAEDRAALALVGAEPLHLSFLDCIYRCGPDAHALYPGPADMFSPLSPADEATVAALAESFAALPPARQVYLPLGVGGHVDHLATRRAAERVFTAPIYYEDYPYTARPGALAEALPPEVRAVWLATAVWLDEAALAAKTAAVGAYVSQLSSFFVDAADLAAQLRADGRRALSDALAGGETAPPWAVAAERLWSAA